jgi:hypothetical protein
MGCSRTAYIPTSFFFRDKLGTLYWGTLSKTPRISSTYSFFAFRLAIIHGTRKPAHCVNFAVARTTLNEKQKLHNGHYKLIGKVLSSFGQHMNYFNMNNMGQGIFRA